MKASGLERFMRIAERALPTIEAVMKQAKIIPEEGSTEGGRGEAKIIPERRETSRGEGKGREAKIVPEGVSERGRSGQ